MKNKFNKPTGVLVSISLWICFGDQSRDSVYEMPLLERKDNLFDKK